MSAVAYDGYDSAESDGGDTVRGEVRDRSDDSDNERPRAPPRLRASGRFRFHPETDSDFDELEREETAKNALLQLAAGRRLKRPEVSGYVAGIRSPQERTWVDKDRGPLIAARNVSDVVRIETTAVTQREQTDDDRLVHVAAEGRFLPVDADGRFGLEPVQTLTALAAALEDANAIHSTTELNSRWALLSTLKAANTRISFGRPRGETEFPVYPRKIELPEPPPHLRRATDALMTWVLSGRLIDLLNQPDMQAYWDLARRLLISYRSMPPVQADEAILNTSTNSAVYTAPWLLMRRVLSSRIDRAEAASARQTFASQLVESGLDNKWVPVEIPPVQHSCVFVLLPASAYSPEFEPTARLNRVISAMAITFRRLLSYFPRADLDSPFCSLLFELQYFSIHTLSGQWPLHADVGARVEYSRKGTLADYYVALSLAVHLDERARSAAQRVFASHPDAVAILRNPLSQTITRVRMVPVSVYHGHRLSPLPSFELLWNRQRMMRGDHRMQAMEAEMLTRDRKSNRLRAFFSRAQNVYVDPMRRPPDVKGNWDAILPGWGSSIVSSESAADTHVRIAARMLWYYAMLVGIDKVTVDTRNPNATEIRLYRRLFNRVLAGRMYNVPGSIVRQWAETQTPDSRVKMILFFEQEWSRGIFGNVIPEAESDTDVMEFLIRGGLRVEQVILAVKGGDKPDGEDNYLSVKATEEVVKAYLQRGEPDIAVTPLMTESTIDALKGSLSDYLEEDNPITTAIRQSMDIDAPGYQVDYTPCLILMPPRRSPAHNGGRTSTWLHLVAQEFAHISGGRYVSKVLPILAYAYELSQERRARGPYKVPMPQVVFEHLERELGDDKLDRALPDVPMHLIHHATPFATFPGDDEKVALELWDTMTSLVYNVHAEPLAEFIDRKQIQVHNDAVDNARKTQYVHNGLRKLRGEPQLEYPSVQRIKDRRATARDTNGILSLPNPSGPAIPPRGEFASDEDGSAHSNGLYGDYMLPTGRIIVDDMSDPAADNAPAEAAAVSAPTVQDALRGQSAAAPAQFQVQVDEKHASPMHDEDDDVVVVIRSPADRPPVSPARQPSPAGRPPVSPARPPSPRQSTLVEPLLPPPRSTDPQTAPTTRRFNQIIVIED